MRRIEPGPGQESVWDYPRPPACEATRARIEVEFEGRIIARSERAYRVLETSHPPVYYIPPEDVRADHVLEAGGASYCEWKGAASYFDVQVGDRKAPRAAWCYFDPTPAFAPIRGYIAFYPSKMDACRVDGETVESQEGDFYGGWITSKVVGPFKGGPGSWGW